MIHIKYRDELGDVEANFDTPEEYSKFKESLILKARAAKAEAIAKQKAEAEARAATAREHWEELKDMAKTLLLKAKDYDVTPEGVIRLLQGALQEMLVDAIAKRTTEACKPKADNEASEDDE